MDNPYSTLPETRFWRLAVADKDPTDISGLWTPKFPLLPDDTVITAGSCFAQHIGRALVKRGFSWFDAEPGPAKLSNSSRKLFNYGIFSFRTGNIYTASQLRQWLSWAVKPDSCPDEVWEANGRFHDPFRPAIEPDGFASAAEMRDSRAATLFSIATAVRKASVLVFTLGLTEGWENGAHGYSYAMCPGTTAGEFDPGQHVFRNYTYPEIRADLEAAIALLREINPDLRILLTVSPVPLTATASKAHVLSATTYSKSTLRAVAGDLAAELDHVDYFPSYEIITGFPFRGMFFEPNLRSVTSRGVDFVMASFFQCLVETFPELEGRLGPSTEGARDKPGSTPAKSRKIKDAPDNFDDFDDDVVCEEELLDAFAKKEPAS